MPKKRDSDLTDAELAAWLARWLAWQPTWLAVTAERAVSRVMGGSCSMPLAAHATFSGELLSMRAAWGDPEGVQSLALVHADATVTDTASAVRLGESVARQLQAAVQAVQARA